MITTAGYNQMHKLYITLYCPVWEMTNRKVTPIGTLQETKEFHQMSHCILEELELGGERGHSRNVFQGGRSHPEALY